MQLKNLGIITSESNWNPNKPLLEPRPPSSGKGKEQFQELTNVRGIYSTSENVFHFGLGTAETVDSLILIWPDGTESVQVDLPANQLLQISKEQGLTESVSTPLNTLFSDHTRAIGISHRHIENKFDDFEREVLLPHKMSRLGPGVASADVNQDGLTDFYIGAAIGSIGQLYLQQTDGSFVVSEFSPWSIHRGFEDIGAVFFDADGDNDPDLYVVSGGNEYALESGGYQDRLYLNEGEGKFINTSGSLPIMMSSGSKALPHDFDGDGDIDLFVCGRQKPGEYSVAARSFLLKNVTVLGEKPKFEDATESLAPGLLAPGMVTDATWADVDGDSDPDLVVVGEWMPIQIFENKEGHTFL